MILKWVRLAKNPFETTILLTFKFGAGRFFKERLISV